MALPGREDIEDIFGKLADPDTAIEFFERVADDVDWTVMGTHPLAGRYHGRSEFIEATFDRLAPLMRDGLRLELEHVHIDGDTAIVELEATATTLEGKPFANRYCWVCRFELEMIVEVRAYLDSAMVAETVAANEPA
ncbi:MAG: nuclear transport factor 2 family protein [Solirubrobacterales bacterium]|nr:nuclear transport factor 2 family protein [Solirubrobacterales bacterium]